VRRLVLTVVVLLALALPGWGATYYVDTASSGGDGTTTATSGAQAAFATIAAAQAAITGDQHDNSLLFKTDCTWREQFTVGAYGTSGHPFTIGKYGVGANPTISGADILSNWHSVGSAVSTQDAINDSGLGLRYSTTYNKLDIRWTTGTSGYDLTRVSLLLGANSASVNGNVWVEIWGTNTDPASSSLISNGTSALVSGLTIPTSAITSWSNNNYTTFTSSGANITNAVWGSGTQTATSGAIATTLGQVLQISLTLTTTGEAPTLSGTGGFPTTGLTSGINNITWTATGTSTVLTLTSTATATYSTTKTYVATWVPFVFPTPPTLAGSTAYHVVFDGDYTVSTSNFIRWYRNSSTVTGFANYYYDTSWHTYSGAFGVITYGSGTGPLWYSSLQTQCTQVFSSVPARLTQGTSINTLTDQQWYWKYGAVYFSNSTTPTGIEASQRTYGIYGLNISYVTVDGVNAKRTSQTGISWNAVSGAITGITVQNSDSSWNGNEGYKQNLSGTNLCTVVYNNISASYNIQQGLSAHGGGVVTINTGAFSNNDDGIENINDSTLTANNLTFTNNRIGLALCLAASGVRGSSTLTNSTFSGSTNYDFYITDDQALTMSGVATSGSTDHSVYLNTTGAVSISNTTITSPGGDGIYNLGAGVITLSKTSIITPANRGIDMNAGTINGNYSIIRGATSNGLLIRSGATGTIYNFDIYGNGTGPWVMSGGTFTLKNSIVSGSGTQEIIADTGSTVTSDYNDFYHAAGGTFTTYHGTDYSWANWKTNSSQDANSKNLDPLFVSTVTPDFHLQAASPCVNAGVDVGLTSDYQGFPVIGLPDIGAYEFGYIPILQSIKKKGRRGPGMQ
jgi:hypothetical protein